MRITELTLSAFKSCQDITLITDARRVLVAGVNGTGKTSIREALKWLLLGQCQATDARGAGADRLMPFGRSPQVHVEASEMALGRIIRRWTPSNHTFTATTLSGPPQAQQQAMYVKLGTHERFLAAVLDSSTFLDLHHAEAKALILSLLSVTVVVEGRSYSLDELDTAYAAAFQARKDKKRDLQRFSVPVQPALAEGQLPIVSEVESRLRGLRAELQVSQRQIGETVGRREALQSQRIEKMRQLTTAEAWRPVAESDQPEQEIAALESELSRSPVQSPVVKGAVPTAATMHTLLTFQPTHGCVLDSQIPCKTAKLVFTNRGKDLRDLQGPAGPAPAIEAASSRLNALLADREARRRTQETIARMTEEVVALDRELSTFPDVSTVERQIVELQGRIAKGEGVLKTVTAHSEAVKVYQKALRAYQALQTEVDELERRCEQLGPNGARVEALAKALGPFQAAVNGFTAAFGWTVGFVLDPSWDVLINDRSASTYSASERYRIGIALQLAIASLSGLSFAIIDELDMLTKATRAKVSAMIQAAVVDQVFILTSRNEDEPLPHTEGLIAYRLGSGTNGQTVLLETVGLKSAA